MPEFCQCGYSRHEPLMWHITAVAGIIHAHETLHLQASTLKYTASTSIEHNDAFAQSDSIHVIEVTRYSDTFPFWELF